MISIVIPVYNAENCLPVCLNSVMGQTFSNWTCILVDDGSTDRSGMICDNYAMRDSRFRVFHKANGGVSSARNYGIRFSESPFLCFLDSDDYVEPNWLDSLTAYSDRCERELVLCQVEHHRSSGVSMLYPIDTGSYPIDYIYKKGGWGYSVNKLYSFRRINDLELSFDTNVRLFEDELFVSKYCAGFSSCTIVNDTHYHYVVPDSFYVKHKDGYSIDSLLYHFSRIDKSNDTCIRYCVNRIIMYMICQCDFATLKNNISNIRSAIRPYICLMEGKRKVLFRFLHKYNYSYVWLLTFALYRCYKKLLGCLFE